MLCLFKKAIYLPRTLLNNNNLAFFAKEAKEAKPAKGDGKGGAPAAPAAPVIT